MVSEAKDVRVSATPEIGGEGTSAIPWARGVGVSATSQLAEEEGVGPMPEPSPIEDIAPVSPVRSMHSQGIVQTPLRDILSCLVMFDLGDIDPNGGADMKVALAPGWMLPYHT